MEAIFVNIEWASGTKAEAVERAKAIIRSKGTEVGAFEEEQEMNGAVLGNLECGESLYDSVDEDDGAFEATDGVVTVSFEIP
jgi:hypothetical protein